MKLSRIRNKSYYTAAFFVNQRRADPQSIILGGLIRTKEQTSEALRHGADAVSLSKPGLWHVLAQTKPEG
ncbi:MAG: glycerol-3-phosphate responsive antiterminator [Brevibacillus sp.]|nr:glycerol-3-phosphate responsive antiterminator [Brevibacillus sp.]